MSRPLSSFSGPGLYLDAMILVAFVDSSSTWHGAARALFAMTVAPATPVRLVTAILTLDEAVFVLLQELVGRPPYGISRSRSQFLAEHPAAVRALMGIIDRPVQALTELLSLEPVLSEDLEAARGEMLRSGLLPRDAIHVAVMRRAGLTGIASDDDAFDRCAGIVRYAP